LANTERRAEVHGAEQLSDCHSQQERRERDRDP
jgi:hypothetical protein